MLDDLGTDGHTLVFRGGGNRDNFIKVAAGLPQEAFAARLQLAGWDLSRAGLSKIEAGLRRVNDAEVWVLAQALSCAITDIYPVRPRGLVAAGTYRVRQDCASSFGVFGFFCFTAGRGSANGFISLLR